MKVKIAFVVLVTMAMISCPREETARVIEEVAPPVVVAKPEKPVKKITLFIGSLTYKTTGCDYWAYSEGRHSVKECLSDLKLSAERLASIQWLEIAGEDIQSLEGIEALTGLEALGIQHTYITSIDRVVSLKKLWNIYIGFSPIHSLPPEGVDSVTYLVIDWVPVDSYLQLLAFKNLEEIQFSYNRRNEANAMEAASILRSRGVKVNVWKWDNANHVSRPDLKNYW